MTMTEQETIIRRRRQQRKVKKLAQRRRRRITLLGLALAAVAFLFFAGKEFPSSEASVEREDEQVQDTTARKTSGKTENGITDRKQVAVPASLDINNPDEVISYLSNKGKTDNDYKKIVQKSELYPEELLSSLAHNTELKEYVLSYPGKYVESKAKVTSEEKPGKHPLFLQWDSRWGYMQYGGVALGLSGCGPACLAMVAYDLTGNTKATPDRVAKYAEENGYYSSGSGTQWSLMTVGATEYGIVGTQMPADEAMIREKLSMGCQIICSMGPGAFTTTGHFVVIRGCDENGLYFNDPNSRERSTKCWAFDEIGSQIKNIWYFGVNH